MLYPYFKPQIQKMGRWRGETFLEYVSESIAEFSKGMLEKMSKNFGYVTLEGGLSHDVTETVVFSEYNVNVSAGAA